MRSIHRGTSLGLLLLLSLPACSALSGSDDSETSESGYTTVGDCNDVGHDVSVSTCTTSHQCGTVALPFCTIGQGVRATTDGEVHVASGIYDEAVELRDGVTVRGGYEPTFSAPPNLDPATNGTTVSTIGTALAWPLTATASVEALRVFVAKTPSGVTTPATRHVISIAGSAHATMKRVRVENDPDAGNASVETALAITTGLGGTVTLVDTVLTANDARGASYGITVDPDASVAITATATTIAAGSAVSWGSGSGESAGILSRGELALVMHGGTVLAGRAGRIHGIQSTSASGVASLDLDGVVVEGNRGPASVGIEMTGGTKLRVHGGSVNGKGPDGRYEGDTSLLAGIAADSVVDVLVDGVDVRGADGTWPRGQSWEPELAYGVRLTNARNVAGAHATIQGSKIEAASYGALRRGIGTDGVPLVLTSSDVVGSKMAIEYGYFGPLRTVGVEVTGTFPAGSHVEIKNNTQIIGGDVRDSCFDYRCGTMGVAISAQVDSVIEDNALIRGAYARSGFIASGIQIQNSASHAIRRNARIVAGHSSEQSTAGGISVVGKDGAPATVAIEDNKLVAGNIDGAVAAGSPTGIFAQYVIATIKNNERIMGGYGNYPRGVFIERGQSASEVTITDNVIDGGTKAGAGLTVTGAKGRIERNTVHACQVPDAAGQPDPLCADATNLAVGNRGLQVDWGYGLVVANNYVFAREIGCIVGAMYPADWKSPLDISFVHNACIATGPTWRADYPVIGLKLGSGFTAKPLIANNILDGVDMAFSHDGGFQNGTPTETYAFLANDLVPHGGQACAANVYLPGKLCYANASELNARNNAVQQLAGNVSLDPGYAQASGLSPAARHLGAGCALGGKGKGVPSVPLDFDKATRSASLPTIGPDECP